VFDGRRITYTLNIKRKHILLATKKEEAIVEGNGKNKLFLSRFLKKEKTK